MKNVILIVLLLVSILFLMPVGLMDLFLGGSVAPFRKFVVPAFWTAWSTQTGAPWLRKVPRPFSWLIQVFLTVLAVITFWGVMIYQPLFALFRLFYRHDVLNPDSQITIGETGEVHTTFENRRQATATQIKKFTLATSRAVSAIPSRLRGYAVSGINQVGESSPTDETLDAVDAPPEIAEFQEVTL